MISEEVRIDHRVHSRLIGARGRAISKIMDEYKVDIRMPGREADDPDLVIINGREDDVLDCRHHLLNLEEEYVCFWCFLVVSFLYSSVRYTMIMISGWLWKPHSNLSDLWMLWATCQTLVKI